MTKDEAMKLALEALERSMEAGVTGIKVDQAIAALRQALEQPEQEPVAWMYVNRDGECEQIEFGTPFDNPSVTLLYTAPPVREWVGLTDEEIIDVLHPLVMADMSDEATDYEISRAIESKLREKNGF